MTAGDEPLELVGGALGDQPAVVEDRDPVGELVGLVQVLRREEDRDAAGDEVADDLPHGAAAARVQAGGRLVEEDDARVADQAHREVEPAPHAAGVGGGRSCVPPRPGRTGRAARRRAAGPRARPRWCRSAIRIRFSSPVSRLSTAENWPVTPIAARTASGSRARSWPATRSVAGVGADQGREDLDDGGLAGAVGAEQREDRSLGDVQVDAVEHDGARRSDLRRPVAAIADCGRVMGSPLGLRLIAVRDGGSRSRRRRCERAPRRSRPTSRGRRRPRGRCGRCPNWELTSSQAAVPSRMPTSRSPILVSSTTEPRTTSPSRTSPLADLATTPACARSTAMLPLAALSRRSPPATPTHVSPLEFLITALPSSSRERAPRPSRP